MSHSYRDSNIIDAMSRGTLQIEGPYSINDDECYRISDYIGVIETTDTYREALDIIHKALENNR